MNVWIETLESGFVGSNDMGSEVKAFLRIFIVSSCDIGGLFGFESLLRGNDFSSGFLTCEESWVGFVVLNLDKAAWVDSIGHWWMLNFDWVDAGVSRSWLGFSDGPFVLVWGSVGGDLHHEAAVGIDLTDEHFQKRWDLGDVKETFI